MSTFGEYLLQYKKQPGQVQTHTWFSPTKKIQTLHVPVNKIDDFLEKVYNYINVTSASVLENPKRGENALTEKINLSLDKFRMFADIDFGVEMFEKHDLPIDETLLRMYMINLVKIYDEIISDLYGIDLLCDRIVAIRLPYKIHIIYPSIVVNKKIAETIANKFIEKLKENEHFSKIIKKNEKLVDKSVYSTGLRMVGMHKSTMGKNKTDAEWRTHENLFGENTYRHCYHFVDPETFEEIPITYDQFVKSSILQIDQNEDYTIGIDKLSFASYIRGKRPVAKAILSSSRSNGDPGSSNMLDDDDSDEDNEDNAHTQNFTQTMLLNSLTSTIKYLKKVYNFLIMEDKIKYQVKKDNDGLIHALLKFRLDTKECHFIGRPHQGNHQYLLVDKKGCRQTCYDENCRGKEHKPVKPGRMPNNVKEELMKLNVLKDDSVMRSNLKEEPSDEQKMTAVDALVERVKLYYPKNDLLINKERVVINDIGIHIGLHDLWCEVCKKVHEKPCTYLIATETGKMCLKCEENTSIGLYYPNPPLTIDSNTRQFFFSNCNVSFVNNTFNNTGDVSVDFQEEPIFEDEILNHLIYESLASTTWTIVKVVHHLGKYHYNCVKSGEWYHFKNHKWMGNNEGAFLYFISENVAHYYRQVRDYYRDNTESPELKQKRITCIQKIIDKLTNINSKMDIIREAKTYFYEEDFYSTQNGTINFEKRLDEKRNLLCFTNGVLDLDTDIFRDGNPYDFITLSVGYDFVPESNPEKRKIVEDFFNNMQPDEEEKTYLLLFLSSMLHGMTNEEVFHIFTGAAANGKSLLRDLLMYTLGDYFESIPANLLTRDRPNSSSPQPEIAKLKGKRAVFGSEPEMGQKINTGFMKWITGNDPILARLLHSNEFVKFLPHFKLVLLCNDIPLMDSNDIGTWRRARIKEFPVVFCDNPRPDNKYEKRIDRTLKNKISECKEEFMLYLIEYFKIYRTMKSLQPTDRVNKMVQKHKKKSNTVLQFVEEKTEVSKGHGILIVDMYQRYLQFMRTENPGEQPVIKAKMIEELQRMSRLIDYSKHVRVRGRKGGQQGIRDRKFKDEQDDDEDLDDEEVLDGANPDIV